MTGVPAGWDIPWGIVGVQKDKVVTGHMGPLAGEMKGTRLAGCGGPLAPSGRELSAKQTEGARGGNGGGLHRVRTCCPSARWLPP